MNSEYDNKKYAAKIKELKVELEELKKQYKVTPPPPQKKPRQRKNKKKKTNKKQN